MKYIMFFLTVFSMLLCYPMKTLDVSSFQKSKITIAIQGEVIEAKVLQVDQHTTIEEALSMVELKEDADTTSLNLAQELVDEDVVIIGKKSESAQKVSINDATLEELMSVSGIGESKARKIIAYREAHGRFQSLEELMNVSGIKEKTWNKLKDSLRL